MAVSRNFSGGSQGSGTSKPCGLPTLWFACEAPFTKTTDITRTTETTKTSQTARNKGFSADLAEITETTEITKTTGIQGANHGLPKQRALRVQTCRKAWVDTAPALVQSSCEGYSCGPELLLQISKPRKDPKTQKSDSKVTFGAPAKVTQKLLKSGSRATFFGPF